MFDLSMSRLGIYSNNLLPFLGADAGGPYTIGPGESVEFDISGSYVAMEHGWNPADWLWYPDNVYVWEWKIDGNVVGPVVSFDELVSDLGLDYGVHTLEMRAEVLLGSGENQINKTGRALSTIEIVPEPCSVLLLGVGGLFLRRRGRCVG